MDGSLDALSICYDSADSPVTSFLLAVSHPALPVIAPNRCALWSAHLGVDGVYVLLQGALNRLVNQYAFGTLKDIRQR